jgi:small-conductance mechanosensitive channel
MKVEHTITWTKMMLPQQELLVGLAQIALTLTGFAALVTVFRKADDSWQPSEILGLYIILEFSIGSTFFAMFPVLIGYLIETEKSVWQISAFILVVFVLVWCLLMLTRVMRVRRTFGVWGVSSLIVVLLIIFPIPLLVLQIANILWLDNFAIYFLHVMYLMMVSGAQFIIFIYNSAGARYETQPPQEIPKHGFSD